MNISPCVTLVTILPLVMDATTHPPPPPVHAQMVKPRERNTRYVDAVMTVPKGTLVSHTQL